MSTKNNAAVKFRDVPNNAIFQVLHDERHGERVVSNRGTWRKVAPSHSVEIHTQSEAVFAQNALCRVIKR